MSAAFELLEPILMVDEIQGNVLGGFNKDHQAIIPLQFADDKATVTAVRSWLSTFATQITWLREVVAYKRELKRRTRAEGVEPTDLIALWKSIAFSFPGLRKLTPEAEGFTDLIFQKGLATASGRLGDPFIPGMPGHVDSWVIGKPGAVPDMLVIIAGDDPAQVEAEVKAFLTEARKAGITSPFFDIGHDLTFYNDEIIHYESGREHFGFKDGISQPGIRGRLSEQTDDFLTQRAATNSTNPNEPEFDERGQPLVCVGDFVLGYGRQDSTSPRRVVTPYKLGPKPYTFDETAVAPYWANNGSFLVYRRLEQDVPAFNQFLKFWAEQLAQKPGFDGITPEKLGALLVGRWPSGAPLMRSPTQENLALGQTSPANNQFGYGQDFDPQDMFEPVIADLGGLRCPLAAHIRKVNPRDLNTDQGQSSVTLVHRLLRRGIPYGSPLPLGATDDPTNQERGLLFLSYQTSIRDQFEFLAQRWMNDSVKPAVEEAGFDMVVGQNSRRSDQRQRFCVVKQVGGISERISTEETLKTEWVIPTGGGYFFAPSRSAMVDVLGLVSNP